MKKVVNLTEQQRDELVVNILTDAVIFEKVATAMSLLTSSRFMNRSKVENLSY